MLLTVWLCVYIPVNGGFVGFDLFGVFVFVVRLCYFGVVVLIGYACNYILLCVL